MRRLSRISSPMMQYLTRESSVNIRVGTKHVVRVGMVKQQRIRVCSSSAKG